MAVTAKSIVQKISLGKRITLVDVRSQEDFERLRIPGSINLPLHAIKTKSYLKQAPIVLTDEGFSYNRLSEVCKTLNQEGFNAKVLYGGLLAWDDFGGRLDGDMHLLREHRRVTFEEFFSEKDYGNQLVVYVGKEASDDSDLPAGIHLSMGSDPKKWAAQLKPHLKNAVTYPYVSVVLIATDDLDGGRIFTLATTANVQHWFLLEGGITGYLNKLVNIAFVAKFKD
jgi:rhodanese-related sulfurtransferase